MGGEATAITWGDIAFSSNPPTVRIEKAWKKSESGAPVLKHPKSQKSKRTVSLWPEIVQALGSPQAGDQLVFQSERTGTHLWYGPFRSRIWVAAINAANDPEKCGPLGLTPIGKRPNIHDLRHTHASWLIAAGAPLPYVQARLGHEDIQTTVNLYGHLLPDAHHQMANIMADVMSGVLPRIEPASLELLA
ncbi:site-specific integrase [Leifsonia xyli]|uniref:site-specific integrase n=1 Tax=Leifsonia xyli TaxID=1575 RepID=UPI0009D732FB|nr:site-specific integrase [Leifsonia xyli]